MGAVAGMGSAYTGWQVGITPLLRMKSLLLWLLYNTGSWLSALTNGLISFSIYFIKRFFPSELVDYSVTRVVLTDEHSESFCCLSPVLLTRVGLCMTILQCSLFLDLSERPLLVLDLIDTPLCWLCLSSSWSDINNHLTCGIRIPPVFSLMQHDSLKCSSSSLSSSVLLHRSERLSNWPIFSISEVQKLYLLLLLLVFLCEVTSLLLLSFWCSLVEELCIKKLSLLSEVPSLEESMRMNLSADSNWSLGSSTTLT